MFLFISKTGESLAIAKRVVDEGEKVIFYVNDSKYVQVGDGVVDKAPVIEAIIDAQGNINRVSLDALLSYNPKLIFVDSADNYFGRLADALKREGQNVVGSSSFSSQIENDDSYAIMLLEINKIKIPTPQLNTNEIVEVCTEVYFNGNEVSDPILSFDEFHLMEHGIGPTCLSGMGSIMFPGSKESKLYKEGLGRITPYLKKTNYKGPISLYTLVTENELYGLGIFARFKPLNFYTMIEGMRTKVSDFLMDLSKGSNKALIFKSLFMLGVRFVVKPFPLNIPQKISSDIILDGINDGNLRHLWFTDVHRTSEDNFICTGATGSLGVATSRGESVRESQRRVYRTIENLDIFEVMYRRDIGDRFHKDYSLLKKWKWL